ncbi:MAG TPA: carboxypeptidase-like regulatory domain-containing protein [Salinivirgaceae bacterium]|nr:carboxypeptidase-like regulatory domain-containing protein [Salinivirgaceae bacterium]
MKTTLFIIAITFLSISAYAEDNKTDKNVKTDATEYVDNVKSVNISGIITDKKSHELLAGAAIFIDGTKYYSDLEGNFNISNIKPGKHTVKVELISYQSIEIEIEVQANQKISIDLVQS